MIPGATAIKRNCYITINNKNIPCHVDTPNNLEITEITVNFTKLVLIAQKIFLQASKSFEKFVSIIVIIFLNYGRFRTVHQSVIADSSSNPHAPLSPTARSSLLFIPFECG